MAQPPMPDGATRTAAAPVVPPSRRKVGYPNSSPNLYPLALTLPPSRREVGNPSHPSPNPYPNPNPPSRRKMGFDLSGCAP